MHPSAVLILWLLAMIVIQAMGTWALVGLGLAILAVSPGSSREWLRSAWRARWLLVTLWLIFAYNTPGEALRDMDWAPTHEGVHEANLHGLRLVLMLGALAVVQGRLGREGVISGLWGLMQPLARWGVDARSLVLRLSLVLENLQNPLPKGEWKKMLSGETWDAGPETVRISLQRWNAADSLRVLAGGAALLVVAAL